MIFCHGVTVNKMNSVKYARLFLNRGYNVVIYDHRRHGKTGEKRQAMDTMKSMI